MRKRKLITRSTMDKLMADTAVGVPLSRAMRNHNISMSRPSVSKLCTRYKDILVMTRMDVNKHTTLLIWNSIFPDWLVTDEQEQPDSMYYNGEWPLGEWVWIQ